MFLEKIALFFFFAFCFAQTKEELEEEFLNIKYLYITAHESFISELNKSVREGRESNQQFFQESLNLTNIILKNFPKNSTLLKELGKLSLEDLEKYPDQILANSSQYLAKAYCLRADIKFRHQQWTEALQDLNNAIEYRCDFEVAYEARSQIYKKFLRNKEALEDTNILIFLLFPDQGGIIAAYSRRAQIYRRMGNFEEALKDCESALLLSKRVYYTYLTRGSIKEHFQEFENALEDYNQAVLLIETGRCVIDRERSSSYTTRGHFKLRQGDLQGALEDFSQIKIFTSASFIFKAELRSRQGDFAGALEAYNQAVEMNEIANPFVYQHRGNYFYEQKDFAQAKQDFQKFLEITSEIENDIFIEKARQEVQEKLLLLQQD